MGGAAIVEPMLLQPLLDGGADGFANTLRSTGVTGVDESQLEVGGGAGVPGVVGHGGGAELLRVVEPAGGAAGCVVNGLDNCDGEPDEPNVCCAAELMPLLAARTPVLKPSRSVVVVSLNALCVRPVIDCGWLAAGVVFCG
jgi:hypothetical protein